MTQAPLVEMRRVDKRFGRLEALKEVSLRLDRREVMGLAGDNGAGKSTLVKILSGVHPADQGQLFFEGRPVELASPQDARLLGIETVYQDLALVEGLSVARNFFLGAEPVQRLGPLRLLDLKKMRSEARRALEGIGIHTRDVDREVAQMSGGERQAVSIARSLHFGRKLLILDEPTSALSVQETRKVLGYIRRAKEGGLSVLLVTHNLHHMFEVCDRFVVLRLGRIAADLRRSETDVGSLTDWVTGAEAR